MRALDLFAGAAGGWALGLHRAGIQTVAACEIDPWRRAAFLRNFPGTKMYSDVQELSADRLLADLGYLPDVVVGSPPCQEISAANSQGEGITDDHPFWEWTRLVLEVRPLWCAAENSPRSRTAGIDGVLDALAAAGYASWPCVVGADNAGANHRRKRLWLIAADAESGRRQGTGRPRHAPGTTVGIGRNAGDDPDADRIVGRWVAREQRQQGREVGYDACDQKCDPPDPHGRLQSEPGRHADGCLDMGSGTNGRPSGHAESGEGLRLGRVLGRGGTEPAQADLRDAPHPDGTRHPFGSSLGRDDGEELPSALRDIGRAWPHWNKGLAGLAASCASAGFGRVDDELPAGMAPGIRNKMIAAYGDAVLPQITEAIARSMMKLMGETDV